jgi:class 3 adenylate cyclase
MAAGREEPLGTQETIGDRLGIAREAFLRYDWPAAFDGFAAARQEMELGPDDLERLAQAAWWTGHHDDCVDARQQAYAAWLERDEAERAAGVALALAENLHEAGKRSVAAGWLQRASRLLADRPESVAHAWLELALARRALFGGEVDDGIERARRALDLGARLGDRDVQALALCLNGWALIVRGEVDDGMSLFEEAGAAAVGGELGPLATGLTYCMMISVFRDLSDYSRAGEWSEAAKRWCSRQTITGFPGVCRVHQAEILRLRGAWPEAELEARRAADELMNFDLSAAALGFYEIGEVRLRIGDLDGAEEAFRQVAELAPFPPEPGSSWLRFRRGDAEGAATSIRRALQDERGPLVRGKYLPVQIEIALARRDLATARAATEELESISERFETQVLRAAAAHAAGTLAVAEGRGDAGIRLLRRAVESWHAQDLRYEAARSRVELAAACRSQDDIEGARRELIAARDAFAKLGAMLDGRLCDERLAELDGAAASAVVARTFMFTDIVGSTALIEAIGDDAWIDLRRWHDTALRTCFGGNGGEEISHAGDGFFVAFPDAAKAVECARDIQRRLAEHRRQHGFAPQVRIGVHAAEATASAGDYSGKGVHAAARIGALAEGGEIVASVPTVEGLPLPVSDPRTVTLKGISDPIRVVSIDWR